MIERDYIAELDNKIVNHEDILTATDILIDLSRDRAGIIQIVSKFFQSFADNAPAHFKDISGNTLSLKRIVGDYGDNKAYLPAISIHEPGCANSVSTHTALSILTPINSAITVDRYRIPPEWDCAVFDPTMKFLLEERIVLEPSDVLVIHPDKHAYHFHFSVPTLLLKIQSQTLTNHFEWSFDADTTHAWQNVAVQARDTYAHHLCIAAAALVDPRLQDPLDEMLSHHAHFVRWAAAQALGQYGRQEGITALEKLSYDSHPHISTTARAILNQIGTT